MVPNDIEINEFLEMFKDKLPNPQHQPRMFQYYWTVFKQLKKGKK